MITDVPGIRVGHATDPVGLTGVTVLLCDRPATCGVELRGGANDVAGLDYLDPRHLVATVNGAVLGGGSRFGEEAIYGVMRWLEERGVGFATGPTVVPHVPGAFLFDLSVGDGRARPTREMGYEAAASASPAPRSAGSPRRSTRRSASSRPTPGSTAPKPPRWPRSGCSASPKRSLRPTRPSTATRSSRSPSATFVPSRAVWAWPPPTR